MKPNNAILRHSLLMVILRVLGRVLRRCWFSFIRWTLRMDISMCARRCARHRAQRELAEALEQVALFDRAIAESQLARYTPAPRDAAPSPATANVQPPAVDKRRQWPMAAWHIEAALYGAMLAVLLANWWL